MDEGLDGVLPARSGSSPVQASATWRWSAVREVLPDLLRWWQAGETAAVGTVTATFRSAPRPPGAAMVVGPDGTAVGSGSGGCVAGAVYELATSVRQWALIGSGGAGAGVA